MFIIITGLTFTVMEFKEVLTSIPEYFKFMVDFSTKPIQTVESLTKEKEDGESVLSLQMVLYPAIGIGISVIIVFIGRAVGMQPDNSNFVLVIDRFMELTGSWALAALPVAWIVLIFMFSIVAHLSIKITGFIVILLGHSPFDGSFRGTLNASLAISAWAIPPFTILIVSLRILDTQHNVWTLIAVMGIFSLALVFYIVAAFAAAHGITLAHSGYLMAMTLTLYIMIQKYASPLFDNRHYYEVAFKSKSSDWRDTSFVVATSNKKIIAEVSGQLSIPISQRKMLTGTLVAGSSDYNKNASHEFQWHYDEEDWGFAEMSMELCDGRPYSDVDTNLQEWLGTVKRFCPWNSYLRKEIERPD
jgi:hypothetical protein